MVRDCSIVSDHGIHNQPKKIILYFQHYLFTVIQYQKWFYATLQVNNIQHCPAPCEHLNAITTSERRQIAQTFYPCQLKFQYTSKMLPWKLKWRDYQYSETLLHYHRYFLPIWQYFTSYIHIFNNYKGSLEMLCLFFFQFSTVFQTLSFLLVTNFFTSWYQWYKTISQLCKH